MHQIRSYRFSVVTLLLVEIVYQTVQKSSCEVAVAGMDDESGRLVDNEHVVVFVYNVQGDVFRHYVEFMWRIR